MANLSKHVVFGFLQRRQRGALTNRSPNKPLRLQFEQLEERNLLSHVAGLAGIVETFEGTSSTAAVVASDRTGVLFDPLTYSTSSSTICALVSLSPGAECSGVPFTPISRPINLLPEPNLETVLDPTFGTDGTVVTELGGGIKAVAAVIQPDGKIIVAGQGPGGSVVLASYNSDGSLDASFGEAGIASFGSEFELWINDIALQADGKILITGFTWQHHTSFVTARITVQGQFDPEFGVGGVVVTDFGDRGAAKSIAVQPDGKILVRGQTGDEFAGDGFALVRYHSDGSLDTTFGDGGIVTDGYESSHKSSSTIAIQDDGRIIVADHGLRRYNPDGSLDESFGTDGVVGETSNQWTYHFLIQDDGKILAVSGDNLTRYNPDGSLDLGFGDNGVVSNDLARGRPVVDEQGNILFYSFSVRRFSSDGHFDGRTSLETMGVSRIVAFAVQSNGSIVVAGGYSSRSSNSGFALVRFQIIELEDNLDGGADDTAPEGGSQEGTANETATTTLDASSFLALTPELFDPVTFGAVSAQQTEPDTPRSDAVQDETVDLALAELTSDDEQDDGTGYLGGGRIETPQTSPTDEALIPDPSLLPPVLNLLLGISG